MPDQGNRVIEQAVIALRGLDEVRALKGRPPVHSPWLRIDQPMIDHFADTIHDRQWIHVDPARAARELPHGHTVAHGFLTLSLLSHMLANCFSFPNRKMSLNYGFDRVRFTSALEVDSDIRAAIALADFADLGPNELRAIWDVRVEVAGRPKPALVCTWLTQMAY
jgi:acyl dehydratase